MQIHWSIFRLRLLILQKIWIVIKVPTVFKVVKSIMNVFKCKVPKKYTLGQGIDFQNSNIIKEGTNYKKTGRFP